MTRLHANCAAKAVVRSGLHEVNASPSLERRIDCGAEAIILRLLFIVPCKGMSNGHADDKINSRKEDGAGDNLEDCLIKK